MKNALYVLWYSKNMCLAEATLNSDKIKTEDLAVIKLHLSESISQLVSHSVTRKFHLI